MDRTWIVAIITLILLIDSNGLHGQVNGPAILHDDPDLAAQFHALTGKKAQDQVIWPCYVKAGMDGIYTYRHMGSHGCPIEFLVLEQGRLFRLGTRRNTVKLQRRLRVKFGYNDEEQENAMQAMTKVISSPCGYPSF